jgi:hypothetical protein
MTHISLPLNAHNAFAVRLPGAEDLKPPYYVMRSNVTSPLKSGRVWSYCRDAPFNSPASGDLLYLR